MGFKLFVAISIISFLVPAIEYDTPSQEGVQQDLPTESGNKDKMWIIGKVIWPGHELSKASVQVFKDIKLKDLYTEGLLLDPEGIYALEIENPGTYYVATFVDDNNNGKFDTGDGMGIYGVSDWADPDQKPEPIRLEKGMRYMGADIEITAVVSDQGRIGPIPAQRPEIKTGISGKLIWPKHRFSNAIVFAYTDPFWNNRMAQAEVSETGEYVIGVSAGLYYLLAVVDDNKTNLLDAGDKFGIWGMTRFGMSAKPIKVEDGQVRSGRNILIIGKIDNSGKPVPLEGSAKDRVGNISMQGEKATLSGKVIWSGHDVKGSIVQVYDDPSMTSVVARAKTSEDGSFQVELPYGDYYINAVVDSDGDGKYTKGDGIGYLGTKDAESQLPEKLTVTGDLQDINLVVSAEFSDSGQLKPVPYEDQTIADKFAESLPIEGGTNTGISGRIVWEDREISTAILIFSKDPEFNNGVRVPLQLSDDGSYVCSTPPGDYYVMAIVDCNDNDQIDAGDGIGFYGAGYLGAGYWGEPQRVTVLDGRTTPYIIIEVTAELDPSGKPNQTRGGIRSCYGDPDSIYDIDQDTQEWWYWSKGIAFRFEKTDPDWELVDTREFEPKDVGSNRANEGSSVGTVFYTFNRSLWAVNADGSNRRWIAYGSHPTGTTDGSKLLFVDNNGGFNLVMPKGSGTMQTVDTLSWRESGLEPAMSPDGKVVAFARDMGGQKQIFIRDLRTGEERSIPSGNMDLGCPTWSPDSELIAYSASLPKPSTETLNRDVFYYDFISGRTECISRSPLDEFDPAWSSVDKHMLVFCRAEGEHSQLWIVNFDANGVPTERQLTRYGGRNPTWSPDGSKIIYENNAQLWTIDPSGENECPIIANGKPIFGNDPFWSR